MAAPRYSFDIQTRHGQRWVIDCVETLEHAARTRATELFANPKCAGVRVIRTWRRPDGLEVDTEIFCQTREVADDTTVRITQVDAVKSRCETLKDYFGFESRQTMARIFREYLAKISVTPTEILHNLRHLKRLSEKDGLMRAAVDMVATLQRRPGEEDTKTRREELYKAVDDMFARARTIDPARLPKLDRKFSDVMASLGPDIDSDQRDYLMLAALSRDLGEIPNWVGKLELLCGMAETESVRTALDLLDGVIADILATDVIEEIIGLQPNLGATIHALLDLADGIEPTTRSGAGAVTARLCQLVADAKLPASRRCIAERAHRALRIPRPLKPNDPAEEPAELRKIIARVLTPTGLHSGPDTAHALTLRFARTVEQGGRTGRRAAINGLFLAMPDMASGVFYLCEAARSDLVHEHLADMEAVFDLVLRTQSIMEFCHQDLDFSARMARATAAHRAMARSPYRSDIRERVTGHIDDLLERFVTGERIIEKLDQPGSHLRDRALRLVRFCGSGLLPNGKAMTKARERVLALLKQPDFPTRFVAGIDDPLAAQTALRDFFLLLKRSGLHGG
jgi:hypothetical protein